MFREPEVRVCIAMLWCLRRDSNPHARRQRLLRSRCLPIPPRRRDAPQYMNKRATVQLRTIDPNNLMVLLDFRRKLAAGEGGQLRTGPNVAHLPATDGSDGAVDDADEPRPSHGADAAEPEGEPLQRRCTAPATGVGEWPNGESDAPDTPSRSPRKVGRIKQTKFRPLTPEQRQQVVDLYRAGIPVKEIVRQTGVNRSTVYRLRGQAGLERHHRFNDEDRAQAIRLRQQG